jgi:hypothetical protein
MLRFDVVSMAPVSKRAAEQLEETDGRAAPAVCPFAIKGPQCSS